MTEKRPTIRLRAREDRRVRAGSPWAFSNEIVMDGAAKSLEPGTAVTLLREDGASLGGGYFNPKSLIAVRLLAPDGEAFDAEFFAGRIKTALQLRERIYAKPFYRLIHAEGDGLPGVVADRFGDALVVQISTAGAERLLDELLAAFDSVIAPKHVILRNDTPARALEGLDSYVRVAKGDPTLPLPLEENGVQFLADPLHGQKTGWFYDQRDNRAFMAQLGYGRALDVFCYTGAFAVGLARAGAKITGIDSSEPALILAKAAAEANGLGARCDFLKADAMVELERRAASGERYDVVVCDPPPFVRARKDLEVGARAYRKLARLAAGVTAPGGFLLLASCSHNIPAERFALECAAGLARTGRNATLIRQAGAGPDHPVHPQLPETAYLKSFVYALS